jgi:Flp pilus assembly protein TadD
VQAATDSTSSLFKLGAVAQMLQLAHAKDWVGVDNMAAAYRSQASSYPPGDPKAAGIQNTEGVAAFRRNDLSAAISAFQRAAQANPADPVALNNLGAVLVRVQRTDEAVNVLTDLLHRSPDRATAWVNLSEAIVADPDAATSALSLAFHFNQNRAKLQQDFTALANTAPDRRLRAVIANILTIADAIPISH